MQVIPGNPAEEVQLSRGPEHFIVQNLDNLFQAGIGAQGRKGQHVAGQFACPEGDKDPLARLRLPGQGGWNQIIKAFVKRDWQNDFDDGARCMHVMVIAEKGI